MERLKLERRGGAMNVRERSESPAPATALVLQSGEFGELESRATVVLASTGDSSYFVSLARTGSARTELARISASLGTFEWVAHAYLIFSSMMIFVFSKNLAHPWKLMGVQAIVATLICMLCVAGARAERRAQHEGVKVATRFWHFLQLSYLTYFVYLVVLGGILYYRKEWQAYWSVMTYSVVAYAIGYVISAVFPIESPWFAMAGMWHGELHGGPFTATIDFIEHYGRVHGAAFPSQHVAG